jgi:hypothetical protein
MKICRKCGRREVEDFGDGEPSNQCVECNDRDIERSNERREWNHYHPDEPKEGG